MSGLSDLATTATTRRVCDVCGAYSGAARGSACPTCANGTMRFLSELQVLRSERRAARRMAGVIAPEQYPRVLEGFVPRSGQRPGSAT